MKHLKSDVGGNSTCRNQHFSFSRVVDICFAPSRVQKGVGSLYSVFILVVSVLVVCQYEWADLFSKCFCQISPIEHEKANMERDEAASKLQSLPVISSIKQYLFHEHLGVFVHH
jgi:hypothetical protein